MPDSTPIKKFIESLRTGKTDITNALDKIFDMGYRADLLACADPDLTQPDLDNFRDETGQPNHLDTLPNYANAMLQSRGVNIGEIDHINDWPPGQKKRVREKLVEALDPAKPRAVYFFWELYNGAFENVHIEDHGPGSDIIITFKSPRKNVQATPSKTGIVEDVQVSVNP